MRRSQFKAPVSLASKRVTLVVVGTLCLWQWPSMGVGRSSQADCFADATLWNTKVHVIILCLRAEVVHYLCHGNRQDNGGIWTGCTNRDIIHVLRAGRSSRGHIVIIARNFTGPIHRWRAPFPPNLRRWHNPDSTYSTRTTRNACRHQQLQQTSGPQYAPAWEKPRSC